jgi:hypothetical protein
MLFTRRDEGIMSVINSRPVVTMQEFLLDKLLLPEIERLPSKRFLAAKWKIFGKPRSYRYHQFGPSQTE